MTIRAVVFDLDGVVIHPFRFRDALEREYGITPAMTAPFFQGPFMDCVEGRADVTEASNLNAKFKMQTPHGRGVLALSAF